MSEQFPHAPLVRTIFEVRFPGETAVDNAKPRLQRALRPSLPHLLVPRVKLDEAMALQPFIFSTEDQSESFQVALNRFAYSTAEYPGYILVGLNLPASIPDVNLTELNSEFTVRLGPGSLKVMLKVEQGSSAAEPERLVLDFDFSRLDDLQLNALADYLDVAHEQTKRVFTDLISDKYLPVMRGETL